MIAEKNGEAISNWLKSIEDELYLFSMIPAVRNLELDEARALMGDLIKEGPNTAGFCWQIHQGLQPLWKDYLLILLQGITSRKP